MAINLSGQQGSPAASLGQIEEEVKNAEDKPAIPYHEEAVTKLIKKRDELASTITNPLKRMEWLATADSHIASTESKLKEKSNLFYHNEERTKLFQRTEDAAKVAINSRDENIVKDLSTSIKTEFEGAFELGHFANYEEYQKGLDSTLNSVQIGVWKNTPDIAEKRKILNDYKAGVIPNRIDADTLIQMEDELQGDELKVEVLTTVDDVMAQFGGGGYGSDPDSTSFDRAKLQLRKIIKDPEKLNLALAELSSRQSADVVADEGISNKLYEDLAVGLRSGKIKPSQITFEQQRTLGKARTDSLIAQVAAAAEPPKYTDPGVISTLKQMARTGGATDINLTKMTTYVNQNGHLIAPKDYDDMIAIATGQKDLSDSGIDDTDAVEAVLGGDGIPKERKNEYIGEVARWRGDFIRKNGRQPHDDERQKFIDSKVIEIVRERSKIMGLFDYDDDEFAYSLKDDEKVAYQEGIDYLIRSGVKIDKATAQNAYDVMRHRDTLSADDYSDYNDVIEELVSAGKPLDLGVIQAEMDKVKASRSKK